MFERIHSYPVNGGEGRGYYHHPLSSKKDLTIASLNINGLRGHFDGLQLFLQSSGIHILALNETKLDPQYPKELTAVAGYQQERLDRTCNGGGVSLYVRDSVKFKPRDDVPTDSLELICVDIQPPRSKPYLVVSWYRPPSDPVGTFSKMENVLSYLDKEGKEIILLGDTNCDLTITAPDQPAENNSKHICSLYELFSLNQLIEEPTRVTLTSSSIIDHVATTSARNIIESGVHEVSISDHYMVFCVGKFEGALKKDHKVVTTRSMKNFDKDAFLADVAGICWERGFSETDDVNVLVTQWSTLFSLIIDKHAPIKTLRVSEKYCPWVNVGLKQLIRSRDKLKKAAVKSKSQLLMSSYRQIRNKIKKQNFELKRQYFSERLAQAKGNMKESWKTINQVVNKRPKSTNIDLLKGPGREIVNRQEISNTMNEYFCSVGKDLASKVEDAPNPMLTGKYNLNPDNKRFNFRPIVVQDIRDAMGKIKTSKSLGSDNVPSYFLKLATPYIENALVFMFNTSLETSQFPDCWKNARITPIFKEGDRAERSNYRPISVLPVISRLFEKLVFNQLYEYLVKNKLIHPGQSGFLKLHSTLTCLLKNTDDWYSGLDTGQMVGTVFIDLKKAFDTVDHDLLCKKLEHYGVQQREPSWFQSYLSNRKQFCRVGGVDSRTGVVEIGVPQGSCLGPLLFLIYINDLPSAVHGSTVSMYADDTSLCLKSRDISQLNEAINEDLAHLDSWLKGNKLSLKVAKTQSMLIATKPKHQTLNNAAEKLHLKIRGSELDVVNKTKYLGVYVDNGLDWKEHIKTVSTKASRAIGFLKHAKNILPIDSLKTLYSSIVEPHFRYCCSVWGCCGTTDIDQLQKLQNRATRIVTNSSFDAPSRPLIKSLGWKTVRKLVHQDSRLMVYKSINGLAPQYMSDLFTRNSACSSRNLRNTKTDWRLPRKTSANGQKCFSYRGAKLWNNLSAEIKQAPSFAVFKQNIQ